jgi:SpoIID/LytB domain protein
MSKYRNLIKAFLGTGIYFSLSLPGLTESINPIMQIGIMQRFGEKPQDTITLKAVPGDRLTLSFSESNQQPSSRRTIFAEQVTINISQTNSPAPLPNLSQSKFGQTETSNKLILSNHRSFENAAASAFRWKAKGIATEIAQPKRWQVWANRDTFNSALNQHLLMLGLHSKGTSIPNSESQSNNKAPQFSWQLNQFRYNRDRLEISSGTGVIQVNKRPYGGSLKLQPNSYRSFTLVNLVPIETYLRGVVPHEIGYQAPFAAVQAQAILARTYALASRHRFKVDDYELCATTQCQVYRGLENTTEFADRAIASTQAQVLTYNNRVIDALYSSNTGGVTANYNDLWDGESRPYLKSRFDIVNNPIAPNLRDLSKEENLKAFFNLRQGFNEEKWQTFRWQKESSLEEIKKNLQEFLLLVGDKQTRIGQVKKLQVKERSTSGRVLKLEVETNSNTLTIEKDEIIDAFLAPNSTFFYLQPIYAENSNSILKGYAFIGGGLGHGVGMSQTGSYNLAKLGWSSDRILSFYYSGTQLQKLKPGMW